MRVNVALAAICATAAWSMAGASWAQDARTAAWREDLALARDAFLQKDRSFTAADRERAARLLDDLAARVDALSDAELQAGLARAAAFAGNAHTRAYLLRNRGVWRRYPVRIWRFSDGWRVIAARDEAEPLLGGKVVSIGGTPVSALEARVRPLFAGNNGWAAYMASYTLTSPDALLGVDALDGEGAAIMVVELDGQLRQARLQPRDARRETPEESWWFLSHRHPATLGWAHALGDTPPPPMLQRPATFYSWRRCADDVAYLAFNRAQDQPAGETLAAFRDRVLADLGAKPPRRLVVDLRYNTGGDLTRGYALFEALAQTPTAQRPGGLVVVINGVTFSAGIAAAAQLMQARPSAVLAGEAAGDALNYWAEGGNVRLPNSGILMHFADRKHHYTVGPNDQPPDRAALNLDVADLDPDVNVGTSWADYRAGRDPVLTAALRRPLTCEPPPQ